MNNIIYTDICLPELKIKIKEKLKMDIMLGLDPSLWALSDALGLVMAPSIKLAVVNIINEITVIEMGLLHFMCKPILVTAPNIKDYPILAKRIIDFAVPECDLRNPSSNFIDWYKSWEK
jgi:hypothetical protein